MRQIFSFLMVALLCVCTACADDFTTTDVSSLPAKAQQYLKHFDMQYSRLALLLQQQDILQTE